MPSIEIHSRLHKGWIRYEQNQFNLQKDQLERRALDVETRMNRMQETLQNKINELVGRVESLGKENSDLKKQMKDKEESPNNFGNALI